MLRGARGQEHRRADAAQHGRGDGRRRLLRTSPRRSSRACKEKRDRCAGDDAGSTAWAPTASRRSTRSRASAAARIRTISPTASIRPGDQAFFDIIQSYMGYRTCYYRTFSVGRATQPQRDAYKQGARVDGPHDRAAQARRLARTVIARSLPDRRGDRLRQRDGRLRPQLLPRPRPRPARAAADLAPQLARRSRSS